MAKLGSMAKLNLDLMIDSGAFSSWKLGDGINIQDYADYLLDHQDCYSFAINLDKIPGKFGKVPTQSEVDEAAEVSWENFEYLESKGIDALPVFHQGERWEVLARMVRSGHDYICISPDNGKNIRQKREWLDKVFNAITDDEGYPYVKTHGLAVTSIDLVFRYPWASVDSATWIQMPGFGGVHIPKFVDGEFRYDRSPTSVIISRKASSSLSSGNHFNNLGEGTKKHILEFFNQEGYSFDDISETFEARSVLAIRVLKRIEETYKEPRFLHPPVDLLSPSVDTSGLEPIQIDHVKVHFALSCAAIYSDMLTAENITERLFTYHILKDKEEGFLPFYASTGCYPFGRCTKRWIDPGNVGDIKDPPIILPRTDKCDEGRKSDPVRKIRQWKRPQTAER